MVIYAIELLFYLDLRKKLRNETVVFIEWMHKGVNRITQILYRRVFYHVRQGFRPWSKIMIQIYVIESFALDSLYIRLFRFSRHMSVDNMSVE